MKRLDEFTAPETREIRQMVFDDAKLAKSAFDRVELVKTSKKLQQKC